MKNIFISYSYQDFEARQLANFLHEKLLILGIGCLGDIVSSEVGSDWQMGITEKINKCSIFVCFVERDNANVMFELGYALAKNKKIIVVGDFRDLPVDLRNMTYLPRESHPFEILTQIEKYIPSAESADMSRYNPQLMSARDSIEMLIDRPDVLDSLEPREFEKLIMQWFLDRGYHVEQDISSRDYGFDLLLHPFRGERAVVEVKKYKSTSQVPLTVIRQLIGSMALERIPYGIVVSTAPFTKSANFFVKDLSPRIFLWTLDDLARMNRMPNDAIEWASQTATH